MINRYHGADEVTPFRWSLKLQSSVIVTVVRLKGNNRLLIVNGNLYAKFQLAA
jgi:hypothetical protein